MPPLLDAGRFLLVTLAFFLDAARTSLALSPPATSIGLVRNSRTIPQLYRGQIVLDSTLNGTKDAVVSDAPFDKGGNTPIDGEDATAAAVVGGGGRTPSDTMAAAFDAAVLGRYACTRFHRHVAADDVTTTNAADSSRPNATESDPVVVREALRCLDLSRRAPSGFNAQPYRILFVHGKAAKDALAEYCIGRNADRVRDSDCTAVFLADRETGRDLGKFKRLVLAAQERGEANRTGGSAASRRSRRPIGKWALRKMQALILLFSSGYPIPRFLAVPISFCVRLGVTLVSILTGRRLLVPTLSSAETWCTKNTMLLAMSYMLGCSSRGLATCPMEGFNSGGVRKALGVPRRFSVPLVVSTGLPYRYKVEDVGMDGEDGTKGNVAAEEEEETDDMGVSHGTPGSISVAATPRYRMEEVLFGDRYGEPVVVTA